MSFSATIYTWASLPLWNLLFLPSPGLGFLPLQPLGRRSGIGRASWSGLLSVLASDSVSHLLGPPQTGHGGITANGAGLVAMAMPQAQVAAGPASAMGMGIHAVDTVTTSAGSASVRIILRVPTVSFVPRATTGTPGEPGASRVGEVGLGKWWGGVGLV